MTRRAGASCRAIRLDFRQGCDPDGDVETLVDQIDEAVVHRQIDYDLGVARHEVAERRHQVQEAEAHRRADPQPPTWRGLKLADGTVGVVEIGQDAGRTLEVGAPGLGQAEGARRPVKEASPKIGFQVGNLSADRRFCDPKRARGVGERLRLGDGYERPERGELIHLFSNREQTCKNGVDCS